MNSSGSMCNVDSFYRDINWKVVNSFLDIFVIMRQRRNSWNYLYSLYSISNVVIYCCSEQLTAYVIYISKLDILRKKTVPSD